MSLTLPPGCAQRFVPERVLGEGGFGAVWLAKQRGLDRAVALKVIHASSANDKDGVERFLAEARVTASLDHPSIVKVIDHAVDDGVPWIAYEYLPGRSLAAILRDGALPLKDAVEITRQIAGALGAAHRAGVIHRDVKAENVMEAGGGHFKLADFGVAKWTSGNAVKTQTGVVIGTPTHIPPEVLTGQPVDATTDLYALGVMLYQMLTGTMPFRGDSLIALVDAIIKEPAPSPRQLRPEVSPDLEALVLRLLSKDRAQRPRDAEALLEALAASPVSGSRVRMSRPGPVRSKDGVTARMEPQPTQASALELPTAVIAPQPTREGGRRGFAAALAGGALLVACALAFVLRAPPVRSPTPSPTPAASVVPAPSPHETSEEDLAERRLQAACVGNAVETAPCHETFAASARSVGEIVKRLCAQPERAPELFDASTQFVLEVLYYYFLLKPAEARYPAGNRLIDQVRGLHRSGETPLISFVRHMVLGSLLDGLGPDNRLAAGQELESALADSERLGEVWKRSPAGLKWRAWRSLRAMESSMAGESDFFSTEKDKIDWIRRRNAAAKEASEVLEIVYGTLSGTGPPYERLMADATVWAGIALGQLRRDPKAAPWYGRLKNGLASEIIARHRKLGLPWYALEGLLELAGQPPDPRSKITR